MEEVEDLSAFQDWEKIRALFPSKKAMRPNKAWVNGLSTRLGDDRLDRLLSDPRSQRLAVILDQFDDDRLKAIRTYASVNLEQALSAFRLTMIGNVTTPIILLSVIHQLSNGGIKEFIGWLHQGDALSMAVIFGFIVFFAMIVFFVVVYAVASLNQARDIRHLIDLFAADRGLFFGLDDLGEHSKP